VPNRIDPYITHELYLRAVHTTGAERSVWERLAEQYALHGAERALGWVHGWWYVTGNRHDWSNALWKKARILLGEADVL